MLVTMDSSKQVNAASTARRIGRKWRGPLLLKYAKNVKAKQNVLKVYFKHSSSSLLHNNIVATQTVSVLHVHIVSVAHAEIFIIRLTAQDA